VGDGDADFEEEGNLEVDGDGDGADTIAPTACMSQQPGTRAKGEEGLQKEKLTSGP
jgi:hypothetical protein